VANKKKEKKKEKKKKRKKKKEKKKEITTEILNRFESLPLLLREAFHGPPQRRNQLKAGRGDTENKRGKKKKKKEKKRRKKREKNKKTEGSPLRTSLTTSQGHSLLPGVCALFPLYVQRV
jgi:hypothetical protein